MSIEIARLRAAVLVVIIMLSSVACSERRSEAERPPELAPGLVRTFEVDLRRFGATPSVHRERPRGAETTISERLEAAPGKPTNGLTRIEQTVSEFADVYFLKAYLAAYAQLGPCPNRAKWSTILAETKPAFFKQGGAERKIHSIVTNQQIACGSSLNLVPASWDREACRELPF
ncbi:MAG TPA: hypothetical protein RMG48_10700 [Myxococcales bacterium LLY-WYZ-16_1]|nr:hypothetical protein [Myxococcales bacterium LLY-WYZ-16_1]